MSNENRGDRPEYTAQDASLVHAGPAQSLPAPEEREASEESADQAKKPTAKQLDAREKRFTEHPRRPMGPTPGNLPETVPDEP